MPTPSPEALDFLLTRRSRPAKTLGPEAPGRTEIETLLTAAARTPDHGKLVPWRFVVIQGDAQTRVAEIAAARLTDLGQEATQVEKHSNAFRMGGAVIAVLAAPVASPKIPRWEQELSAGAACLALLNASLAAGWGANWLTGPLTHDAAFLETALGWQGDGFVAGFIHIGAETVAPAERDRPDLDEITQWL